MTSRGIENQSRRYTVGIAKGSAAINEMRMLLRHWTPGESHSGFLKRVQETGILGKHTARRTRDMVNQVFRPRLLTPDDRAARALKRFVEAGGDTQTFRELLLLYEARSEALLYDFVTMKFWPACHSGALVVTLDDVLSFFEEGVRAGRLPNPWSEKVQPKVARGVLGALRAFGFIREEKRGHREIVPYRMTDAGVIYLAHELHFRNSTDAAVAEHSDWELFGLNRDQVLNRLDILGPAFELMVQRAGSVVRIAWSYTTMESVIDAITR